MKSKKAVFSSSVAYTCVLLLLTRIPTCRPALVTITATQDNLEDNKKGKWETNTYAEYSISVMYSRNDIQVRNTSTVVLN